MSWQEIAGNWLLVPECPRGIIHFLGGAFIAAAPHLTYRWLLENLYAEGYCIVATPFVNTFDHGAISTEVRTTFEQALIYLNRRFDTTAIPTYGMGHSMGCKVHLLLGSLHDVQRAGNILISFNNYPARKSIPLLEQVIQFAPDFKVEFVPSPAQTLRLIYEQYPTTENLLVKFRNDTIDQTRALSDVLISLFPEHTQVKILSGSHTTPVAQDINWQTSNFSPIDALGQFVKQEFYRDLKQLKQVIIDWLSVRPCE